MALREQLGEIRIDNNVVGTIAAIASQDIEGIVCMGGKLSFREMLGKKDIEKGVKVEIEGGRANIDMEVKIVFGRNMYEAAHELQRKVKDNVERMTGLTVENVNVKINGIIINEKKEKSPAKEKTSGADNKK